MFGDVKSEVNEGLVSRSCRMVLDFCKKQEGEGVTCVIKAAMIEIYNEQINDLLNKDGKNLQLREDAQQGVYIPKDWWHTVIGSFNSIAMSVEVMSV